MSAQVAHTPNPNKMSHFSAKKGSIFGSGEGMVFNYQSIESKSLTLTPTIKLESFLSHQLTAWILTSLIIIYSTLVLIRIAFEQETEPVHFELDILELIFLSIFVTELILRIIVYKSIYFKYYWNIFDIIIIAVCLLVIIGSLANSNITETQAFKLGKVLRIFRLFLMFRKMNTIHKYKNKIILKRATVVNVTSPSEKVIDILTSLLNMDWISYQTGLKAELEWCITMIKEQKIYQTSVRAGKEDLIDLVSWAVNQNAYEDPDSPLKTQNYIKVVTMDKFSSDVDQVLADCHSWDFDIFKLEEISESHSLEIMISHLFTLYNLYHTLSYDNLRLINFIKAIEAGYHTENPYHTATHAADVVQSYYYFLSTCHAISICSLNDSDIAACLISSAIHDYDHPGYNNLFLINSLNTLALTYNDKSVLENHHIASSFKLLLETKNNFIENSSKEEKKRFRSKTISLVLATDFARHFVDMGKFQLKFTNGSIKDEDDKLMVMEMLMHTSDVCNPSRPWKVCHEWASRVMTEFFNQGDKERELGLPISNLCDRHTVNIPKSQIGFIELFIEPTFNMVELILPGVVENIRIIGCNKEKWKELAEINSLKC